MQDVAKLLKKNIVAKYKDYTVKELKKALQNLKSKMVDLSEIKYVSRTLRVGQNVVCRMIN